MRFFDDTPEGRADWLAWRKIGGSDIANAVWGHYGGAYAVVAEHQGLTTAREDDDGRMNRGHRWETRIADLVLTVEGLYVFCEQACIEHGQAPHHTATLDGLLAPTPTIGDWGDTTAVLEVKTLGRGAPTKWDAWRTQTQWAMHVTGHSDALIVCAYIDDDTDKFTGCRLEWVQADTHQQAFYTSLADEMWAHVTASTLPEPDWPTALPIVKELTAKADPDRDIIDLEHLADQVTRFAQLKTALKDADDELKTLEARIKHEIGDATKATTTAHTITYSRNQKVFTAASAEAFALVYPEYGLTPADDRNVFKTIDKKLYADLGEHIGTRTITVRENK